MKATINKNEGISLIVLVITIIIMIILATAVILSLNSSNLVDKATIAKYKSDLSSLQEILVAKVAERQLSNQDTSGRYVLSDWNIENSEYEDKVIIENTKIVLRATENEGLIVAADELGISRVSSSETTTLANTRGLDLLNYRIYGNSVQDGTPTPEEPVEVLSLGENGSIDVASSGKNLFDKDNARLLEEGIYVPSQTDATNQLINGSYNRVISLYIQCKHNTTYTVNQFLPVTTNSRLRTATTVDVPAQNVFVTNKSGLSDWDGNPVIITSSNNDNYLVVQFCVFQTPYTNEELLSNLQIEENAIATGYEPYQEVTTTIDLTGHEPLRKIGDVADYIDYENKKIVRNIGCLNGTNLNWKILSQSTLKIFDADTIGVPRPKTTLNDTNSALCSRAKQGYSDTASRIGAVNQFCMFVRTNEKLLTRFAYSTDTTITLEQFKEKLLLWEREGKPLIFYYKLETPIDEPFECPVIPTLNGTTMLSIKDENNIQPSSVITEY